jgi:hypothetical protein
MASRSARCVASRCVLVSATSISFWRKRSDSSKASGSTSSGPGIPARSDAVARVSHAEMWVITSRTDHSPHTPGTSISVDVSGSRVRLNERHESSIAARTCSLINETLFLIRTYQKITWTSRGRPATSSHVSPGLYLPTAKIGLTPIVAQRSFSPVLKAHLHHHGSHI